MLSQNPYYFHENTKSFLLIFPENKKTTLQYSKLMSNFPRAVHG